MMSPFYITIAVGALVLGLSIGGVIGYVAGKREASARGNYFAETTLRLGGVLDAFQKSVIDIVRWLPEVAGRPGRDARPEDVTPDNTREAVELLRTRLREALALVRKLETKAEGTD